MRSHLISKTHKRVESHLIALTYENISTLVYAKREPRVLRLGDSDRKDMESQFKSQILVVIPLPRGRGIGKRRRAKIKPIAVAVSLSRPVLHVAMVWTYM